jgi:hypothetical protein
MTPEEFYNKVIDLLDLSPEEQETLRYEFNFGDVDALPFDGYSICDCFERTRQYNAARIDVWLDQVAGCYNPFKHW